MSDEIDYVALIAEVELIVLGGQDWLARARDGSIKASQETIERRAKRLELQQQILSIFKRAQERRAARETRNV